MVDCHLFIRCSDPKTHVSYCLCVVTNHCHKCIGPKGSFWVASIPLYVFTNKTYKWQHYLMGVVVFDYAFLSWKYIWSACAKACLWAHTAILVKCSGAIQGFHSHLSQQWATLAKQNHFNSPKPNRLPLKGFDAVICRNCCADHLCFRAVLVFGFGRTNSFVGLGPANTIGRIICFPTLASTTQLLNKSSSLAKPNS